MSIMGTGVAAGVAQVGLQAQQVAQQRDKQVRETKRSVKRVNDAYEPRLRVPEEDGDADATTRLVVDDDKQPPQHPSQQPEPPADDEAQRQAAEQRPRLDLKV